MTPETIREILAKHKAWLADEPGGERAVLRGSDLRDSDLSHSDLSGSDLRGSVLRGSDLRHSDLSHSDLRGSDLSGSVLRGSDLRHSDLSHSDLRGSDLSGSDLSGSDLRGSVLRDSDLSGSDLSGSVLRGSDLRDSDLRDSDLRHSDLRGSDLRGSDLRGSDLRGSDLSGSKIDPLPAARLSIVPEVGAYEGFKKCRDGAIVRLRIPAEARRSSATGRKCRAEFAEVLAIEGPGGAPLAEARSIHDERFVYRVGEVVRAADWCEDRWEECAGGIHHFLTRAEAQDWAG